MPQIGEIRKAKEIGYAGTKNLIWHSCLDCGKESWVYLKKGIAQSLRCKHCAYKGIKNPFWKGGKVKDKKGYINIKLFSDDFFFPMTTKKGYVFEHRLIVAKSLGRCLHRWEIVHHKNHIRDDNRVENLQLISDDRHKQITILEAKIEQLEESIALLKSENKKLKLRNIELEKKFSNGMAEAEWYQQFERRK